MWEIKRYRKEMKREWDEFAARSRNSTFLFQRDYMDYHADRFDDFSLMAYRNGCLSALLPANILDRTQISHAGLTYGGWLLPVGGPDTTEIFTLWKAWLGWCRETGIEKIVYKPLPYIYARCPSEEDLYMLFLCGAKPVRTDISSAIDLRNNPGFNKLQRRHLKSAGRNIECKEVQVADADSIREFYVLLAECLRERHDTRPVHTFEELRLLMKLFPENIRIWTASETSSGRIVAGVCVYETDLCAHCQYISTSEAGREANALAPLFHKMIEEYGARGFRYFDFGISNEEGGRALNPGLNRQKTSYGASGVAYARYEISVSCALESMPSELWPPK